MQKATALELRQNMGAIVRKLQATGEPILLEKDRKPVAVLISIQDYKKRFADVDADIARREIVQEIKNAHLSLPKGMASPDIIRDLRAGRP